MIVMKFGGSSLASATSIDRVVSIVESQTECRPIVVASAMGDTTDELLEILAHARRADSYSALKLQDEVRSRHFAVCEELLHREQRHEMDRYLRDTFRDLHVRMLELAEGDRRFSDELQDWTASLGEQISSRILAAVLEERCGPTVHLDARKLILTNSRFTNAEPFYWETYSRLRWTVPVLARESVPVLGGFIGSTEDGRTTTLGRGGSDLTASIVGAAINADEIQVWKDVDGMLTCDPRMMKGAHQLKRLTYEEATELARAGATILHPDTMAPARRLRIPILLKNTFWPQGDGTRIEHRSSICSPPQVKSLAVRSGVTLLEVRSPGGENQLAALSELCNRPGSVASVFCQCGNSTYVAIDESSRVFEESVTASPCLEVHVHSHQAVLTLVGEGMDKEEIAKKAGTALSSIPHFVISGDAETACLRVVVSQERSTETLQLLHHAFFANPDPRFFFKAETAEKPRRSVAEKLLQEATSSAPQRFTGRPTLLQFN